MGVLYKKKEPRVFFDRSTLDGIKDFIEVEDKKVTIFLSASKNDGGAFVIDGWYVPKQGSTKYINSISDDSELQLLGEKSLEDTPDSLYIGAIQCGGDIKKDMDTTSRNYFNALFNGVSEYFYMKMDASGEIVCNVETPIFTFTDVNVSIVRPCADEEFLNTLREEYKKKISTTTSSTQTKRTVHIPSELVEKKMNWRDVV